MSDLYSLEKAAEHADQLIETARKRPDKLLDSSGTTSKWRSIHQKLLELYLEESKKEPICKNLKCTSHLLDKLVKKEQLNTLVVNLYPGNEGYSLMLKGRNGSDSETIKLPYEESELLEYIDAEELPPLLVDLLDRAQASVFYCGCVILEIRDYRRTTTNTFDTRYVLLKPTAHTFICDINAITNDGNRWTQDDVFSLESQLLLNINDRLCLDPSPTVFYVSNKINYEKNKFNTHALKRSVKKFSQAAVNRKRKMAQCPAPQHLKLYDFINKKKDRLKPGPPVNLKVGKTEVPVVPKTCVDMWRQREIQLTPPESIDVDKYAKAIDKPKLTLDNTPVLIEEYTFETERNHGKVNYSRLTISQRLSDEHYIGELYVDRDYAETQLRGSTCRFPLTTKANVDKYIRQFREIFTEEGRRQVKITHQIPGQPPTVSYTQTLQSMTPTQVAIGGTQALITQATNLAATLTGQLGMPGSADSVKKHPPIRLSLSLNPGVAVTVANLISPQATPAQSPVQAAMPPTAQLTLNLQQQQRIRQMGLYTMQRPPGTESPATPPTSGSHLPSYSQATGPSGQVLTTTPSLSKLGSHIVKTPTHTPSPNVGLLTTGSRRSSLAADVTGLSQTLAQGTALLTTSASSAPSTPASNPGDLPLGFTVTTTTASGQPVGTLLQGATPPPNVNITNLAGLPSNINLQNLAGLQHVGIAGLQSLQNLQNVQVSVAGVSLPSGIAVPVPLTVINTNPSLSSQPGIIVSSLPNVIATTSASDSQATAINPQGGQQINTSTPTYVTMVTAVPPSSGSAAPSTNVTSQTVSSAIPTTVFTSQSGMLQLPIGLSGNLQFMTATGIKGAQGLRPGTPLLLSQIPGQPGQTMQLLSAANLQPRAQLSNPAQGGTQALTGQPKINAHGATGTVLAPAAPSGAPTVSGLTQLRPGQPQTLTTQQFMQLNPQLAHLALANKQNPQQQLQLQQQLLLGKHPGPQQQQHGLKKSKKRTTPTPPKN